MTMNDGFYHYQLSLYEKMNVLASLFVDPENPDDFIAGYIAHINPRQVVLNAVSPVGHYDGLMAVRLTEVSSVLGEDEYSERLRRLLLLRGEEPRESLQVEPEEDLFHAMCRKALEDGRVITLWCGESEYVGRVTELNDMRVTIGALDFFGQNPAEVTLALRDIDLASSGSEDDEMFAVLSENKLPE